MQFKHPEILYFLFLLVIPILVHLFQLRKFKITYFTNVKLLSELSAQTRKSSKIKKYLLLATRLFLLTFLIVAFAQPYFEAKDNKNKNNELFLIIDNSFSMQAKGQNGALLQRAIQEVLEVTPSNLQLSVITNGEEFWNTTIPLIEKDLQKLSYSAIPFSLDQALTKVKSHHSNHTKDIVIITDGIGITSASVEKLPKESNLHFIIPEAEKLENVAIDSVFIAQSLENFYEIGVSISSNQWNTGNSEEKAIPVSMFQKDNLIAKTILKLNKPKQTIHFTIPKDEFNGYVSLNDNSLAFDNQLYFSIPKPKKLSILSIGETTKATFLSKLYPEPDFHYQNVGIQELNYSQIANQDAIILNEAENIPVALHSNLKKFVTSGGNLIVIPSEKNEIQNLNSFLSNFGNIQITNLQNQEKKITKINFGNPLFQDVFEKKISNFQYPLVRKSFAIQSTGSQAITLEDQSGFLSTFYKNSGALFLFSAPLNKENSNFQNSPLIVPTFYKMGTNNSKNGVRYETIGENNSIIVPAILSKEEVVSIRNDKEEFIPMQQIMEDKVKISCGDLPKSAGNFQIIQNKKNVGNLCFNYNRKESIVTPPSNEIIKQLPTEDSLESFLDTVAITRNDNPIWKWFLAFTLVFLILEILIQKYIQ